MAMFKCVNSNLGKEQKILTVNHISNDFVNYIFKNRIVNAVDCTKIIMALYINSGYSRMIIFEKINRTWSLYNVTYNQNTGQKYINDIPSDKVMITNDGNDLILQDNWFSSDWQVISCVGY